MNNIILLASSGQRVGKTTLADELVKRSIVQHKDSFAVYIKEIALNIHKAVSYENLSKDEFFQTRKDEKMYVRKKIS